MHSPEFSITRRQAIAGAGVVATAATLAACSTYGKDSDSGSAATTAAGGSDTPAGAIAATSDIPVGSGKIFDEIVVTQPVAGEFHGLSPVCPHQGCKVATITGGEIVCPCHGSKFALDGAVVNGPAKSGLEAIAIKIEGDSIVSG